MVSDNLLIRRIRFQPSPQFDILAPAICKAGKEKTGLAYRQGIEVRDVVAIRPGVLVGNVGNHKTEASLKAPAVGELISPLTAGGIRKKIGAHRQNIEIEERVAVRLGPGKFQWKTPVSSNLPGKQFVLKTLLTSIANRIVLRQSGECGGLQKPA